MIVLHSTAAECDLVNNVNIIDQNIVQRHYAVQPYPALVERLGMVHLPAFFEDELEDVPDVLIWTKDVGFHDRLPNFFDQARIGQVRRVIDENNLAPGRFDFVNDARAGRDDVHVVFAPQSLLNNFHVQESEKTTAKPESEGN